VGAAFACIQLLFKRGSREYRARILVSSIVIRKVSIFNGEFFYDRYIVAVRSTDEQRCQLHQYPYL
jgi:hypothetical protein